MGLQLPSGILENTEAALALFAVVICVAGMLLCAGVFAASFLAIQAADNAISPQFDSAQAIVSDAQSMLLSASQSTQSLADAIAYMSNATSSYSSSTGSLSGTLGGLAKTPPFSLDPSFASSAGELQGASEYFASASASLNSSATTASALSSSLTGATADIGRAGKSISDAKASFKSAVSLLEIASFLAFLMMVAFFSSVILVAVSILLSHYPRLFAKKQGQNEAAGKKEQG